MTDTYRRFRAIRCDSPIFRLGRRLLARCLKDDIPVLEGFPVPVRRLTTPVRQPHNLTA